MVGTNTTIDVVGKEDPPIIIVDSIESGLDFRPHHSHSFDESSTDKTYCTNFRVSDALCHCVIKIPSQ